MEQIKMKVENLESSKGNKIANQFQVRTEKGIFFQSYNSLICFVSNDGTSTILDEKFWDYSKTTSKYRNIFLGETTKETQEKINKGIYTLANLN